jgi:PAS domain S-box-containing protein
MIARRLVPSALLAPLILGWLVLRGEHAGRFEAEAGIELFALVNVVVFGGLIWANAFHLHNTETERELAWKSLRRSDEALRSNQAKLQGIVSSAMDAIVSVDEHQRIVLFNRAAEAMFQCAAAEAVGSTLDRFIPESVREVHREHIRRFAIQGITNRSMTSPGILAAIRSNGEEFPIEATISQVQADGEQLYTVILRDITERKQGEEARARLAAIVESSSDAIISETFDGIILSWNQSAARLFGYSAKEAIGQPITLIIPPDRMGEEIALLERSRRGDRTDHYETVRMDKSGRHIDVSVTISPIFDSAGAVTGISKSVRDITERKQAEEALSKQAEVLRLRIAALDAAANSIVMTDAKGTIQWVNLAFTKLTGYSAAEAIGQNPKVLKSGKHDDPFYKDMWHTILSGSRYWFCQSRQGLSAGSWWYWRPRREFRIVCIQRLPRMFPTTLLASFPSRMCMILTEVSFGKIRFLLCNALAQA